MQYLKLFLVAFICATMHFSAAAQCSVNQSAVPVVLEVPIVNRNSMDLKGDPDNVTFTVCDPMAANAFLNMIGWSIMQSTSTAPSLCSEIQITVKGMGEYDFVPGGADNISGMCSPYNTIHLIDISASNVKADANGCVTVEISETLDNFPNAADAVINSGTIFLHGFKCVDIVPTIGEWGLIILLLTLLIFGVVAVKTGAYRQAKNLV